MISERLRKLATLLKGPLKKVKPSIRTIPNLLASRTEEGSMGSLDPELVKEKEDVQSPGKS